jgi:hypothetical protein
MRPDIRCRCCAAFAVLFLVSAWIPANAQDANADLLVGHWRKTTIESGPVDENLILRGDGAAARWIVTANIRTAVEGGAWQVEGKTLTILLQGDRVISAPFTFHEGNLVFPNIPNRRGFWEKITG